MGKVVTNHGMKSWDMNMKILNVDDFGMTILRPHSHTPTLRPTIILGKFEWLSLLKNDLFIHIPPLSCDLLKVRGYVPFIFSSLEVSI